MVTNSFSISGLAAILLASIPLTFALLFDFYARKVPTYQNGHFGNFAHGFCSRCLVRSSTQPTKHSIRMNTLG